MTLKVTGPAANVERAFSVKLRQVPSPLRTTMRFGYTFYAPLTRGKIPAEGFADSWGVAGLDNRPRYRPHFRSVPTG